MIVLWCLIGLAGTPAQAMRPRPIRHYLTGWTRTTWYLPTGYATASGRWPRYGLVAAPPQIPFGARVVVPGLGVFLCADRGADIYGNHLDIFLDYPNEQVVRDYYRGVYWEAP